MLWIFLNITHVICFVYGWHFWLLQECSYVHPCVGLIHMWIMIPKKVINSVIVISSDYVFPETVLEILYSECILYFFKISNQIPIGMNINKESKGDFKYLYLYSSHSFVILFIPWKEAVFLGSSYFQWKPSMYSDSYI